MDNSMRLELVRRNMDRWLAKQRNCLDLQDVIDGWRDGSLLRRLRRSAYDAEADRIESLDPEDEHMLIRLAEILGLIPTGNDATANIKRAEALCQLGELYSNGCSVEQNAETAYRLYVEAADMGSLWALRNLAECCEHGTGVEPDFIKAIELFERLSRQADAQMLAAIAKSYCSKGSVSRAHHYWSPVKAAYWYRRAYEAGDAEAAMWIAESFWSSGDVDQAIQWYEKAAEGGLPDALRKIAKRLRRGNAERDIKPDPAKSEAFYERIRREGNADVLLNAGRDIDKWWRHGVRHVSATAREALRWYDLAYKAGNMQAAVQMANLFRNMKDTQKAIAWYRQAADQGYVEAMKVLSRLYSRLYEIGGDDMPQDMDKALQWAERAAQAGDSWACSMLVGTSYGRFARLFKAPEDLQKFIRCCEKAYEAGDDRAAVYIGDLYAGDLYRKAGPSGSPDYECAVHWYSCAYGDGDPGGARGIGDVCLNFHEDYDEARIWYEIACDEGDRLGAFGLGNIYRFGLGTAKDGPTAVMFYERAADGAFGLVEAAVALYEMYRDGDGVEKDLDRAEYWLDYAEID